MHNVPGWGLQIWHFGRGLAFAAWANKTAAESASEDTQKAAAELQSFEVRILSYTLFAEPKRPISVATCRSREVPEPPQGLVTVAAACYPACHGAAAIASEFQAA